MKKCPFGKFSGGCQTRARGQHRLKHYPYVANSDFHKPKHLYSWKTLLRCEKRWDAIARTLRDNVDVALTLYRDGRSAA